MTRLPLIAAALGASMVSGPQKVAENPKMAVRVLELRHPGVVWQEHSIRADFSDDQTADLALMGVNPEMLVVALILGPVHGGSTTVRHWWEVGADGLEASCMRDASLQVEELEFPEQLDANQSLQAKEARGRGVKGLRLSAPRCAVLHLYWDSRSKTLAWWR